MSGSCIECSRSCWLRCSLGSTEELFNLVVATGELVTAVLDVLGIAGAGEAAEVLENFPILSLKAETL